jgi:hypothetical protein
MDAIKDAKAVAKEEAKEKPNTETKATGEVNPKIAEWVEKNPWYNRSKAMSETTNEIAQEIRSKYPFYTEEQFLEELDKELETTFTPEKLGRKQKPRNPVEGATGGNSSSGTKGRQYSDLPADAKAACDDFIKQGIFKTRDEYLKEYPW